MTLSARNNFLKGEIILAALCLCLVAAGGFITFPAYPEAATSAALRSRGIIQALIKDTVSPSAYVPFFTILGAVAYSFISIIFINHFFEKTQSPEIVFFSLFAISLSFEFVRVLIPLKRIFPFPAMYLITGARILFFSRFFGLFSLFAASVYAAGLDVQKQQNAFFIVILAPLIISLNVPIDSLVWDSSFEMLIGYHTMFAIVETGIMAITLVTFLISAYLRGSRTFIYIGIGTFLIFAGRNILLNSDTWITPIPGLLCMAVSTWFVCSCLHKEYLWL